MKKLRFPLKMENGTEVRTLEELREHFSLSEVWQYYENGKLVTWLRDRYLEDLAEAVEALDGEEANRRLCEIFGVPYEEVSEERLEETTEHRRKLALLREKCSEPEYEGVVDRIAFDQEDLYDLLDAGETEIYLLGESFSVPGAKRGMRYIGINQPTVVISAKDPVDLEDYDIWCVNCVLVGGYKPTAVEIKAEEREVGESATNSEEEKIVWKMEPFVVELLKTLEEGMKDLRESKFALDGATIGSFDVFDYGSGQYEHPRKSRAMLACKEALEELLDDMKDELDDARDDMIDEVTNFLDDAEDELTDFVEEFLEIYDEYMEAEARPEWREYAVKVRESHFDEDELESYVEGLNLESQFESMVESFFETRFRELSFQKYHILCELSEEDGEYAFDLERSYEAASEDMEEILQEGMSFVMSSGLSIYLTSLFQFEGFLRDRIREAFAISGSDGKSENGR